MHRQVEFSKASYDLEKFPLPITVEDCEENKYGTTITLEGINQNLNYPNPERLKEILIRDYDREIDFNIVSFNMPALTGLTSIDLGDWLGTGR